MGDVSRGYDRVWSEVDRAVRIGARTNPTPLGLLSQPSETLYQYTAFSDNRQLAASYQHQPMATADSLPAASYQHQQTDSPMEISYPMPLTQMTKPNNTTRRPTVTNGS